jgi:2-oxoglutarate-Fe(II)-dependent oxygenase superfamily protein
LPAGYAAQINFNTIHSGVFVDLRQQITGIDGLIPDPALDNGGLHESQTGGKFAMHIDFNQHFVTKLDARLVFITYLSTLASHSSSADEGKCKVEFEPAFARSILFLETSKSLHGCPKPVNAPGGRPRRSAAAYFYSNGHPEGKGKSTQFISTIFPMAVTETRRGRAIAAIKLVTPPIVLSWFRN